MLERALSYATYGWLVFPCHSIQNGTCSCGKGPRCTSPGKHPRTVNGVKDATTNTDRITQWWTSWPDANIALACGRQTGLFVIDIDPSKDGYASIDAFEQERGDALPVTLTSLTGGGGRHLFYRYPAEGSVGNKVGWLSGVDVRSDGGYVILPDGTHISGGTYRWHNLGQVSAIPAPLDVLVSLRSNGAASSKGELADAATILRGVPEGKRDDTLFRWACRLRRQHSTDADGGRAVIELLVMQAARAASPPFPEAEAIKCVEQAFKQDHTDEEWNWAYLDGDGERIHNLTDLGNAHRFTEAYSSRLRYVSGWGWLHWTETGWQVAGHDLAALQLAQQVPDVIRHEAVRFQDDPRSQRALQAWALKSEAAGRIAAMVSLARSSTSVLRDIDDFDSDPYALACANGIVDLRTGEMRPIQPDDYTTKSTGVAYNPAATLPLWQQFLHAATDGDADLQDYLQLAAGYSLTGSNEMECFFIVSGQPGSGKSTFMDALAGAMGSYQTVTQADTFMYKRGQSVRSDELARFAGLRMVSVSEIRQGDSFHESLVKQFTGDDKISARYLYQSSFEFRPQLKLWIVTNHDPDTRDQGMWRRLKKIAFNHHVPPEKRDPRLKALLRDPAIGGQAVLAWAVQGAIKWCAERRLPEPLSVVDATLAYHAEQDRFAIFLEETTERITDSHTTVREMYGAYRMWCQGTGEMPMRVTQFTPELRTRGFDIVRMEPHNRPTVRDVKLRTPQLSMESGSVQWS